MQTFREISTKCGLRSPVPLIDICANVATFKWQNTHDGLIQRSRACNVNNAFIAGLALDQCEEAVALCKRFKSQDYFRMGIGTHPHFSSQLESFDKKTFFDTFDNLLYCNESDNESQSTLTSSNAENIDVAAIDKNSKHDFITAIGECGLDYNRMASDKEIQKRIFEYHIEYAIENNLPLFVHEREAHDDMIAMLQHYFGTNGKNGSDSSSNTPIVIHCFTGQPSELEKYLSNGYYIGMTTYITNKTRPNVKQLIQCMNTIPLDRLMIETDCPYMKPLFERPYFNKESKHLIESQLLPIINKAHEEARGQPVKKIPNEPCLLPAILPLLSKCYDKSIEQIAQATTDNATSFFKFKQLCQEEANVQQINIVSDT